jgi:hypothetical protein
MVAAGHRSTLSPASDYMTGQTLIADGGCLAK